MIDRVYLVWGLIMLVGFVGSALYSGMETGVYVINRVRVHIRAMRGNKAATVLQRLMRTPTVLLTTLLIGNNIANYMGSAALAVILEHMGMSDAQTIIINVLIVTPMLFVFGETLPKDLFAAHADGLLYPLASVLEGSRRLFHFTGMLPLIAWSINRLVARLHRKQQRGRVDAWRPRMQVVHLVREGAGKGVISDEQSKIVDRVIAMSHRTVAEEMTPWSAVSCVKVGVDASALREIVSTTGRSRFVVLDEHNQPVGVIHAVETLLRDTSPLDPGDQLIAPLPRFERSHLVHDALAEMQRSHTAMALVVENDKPVGIVTIKDLVETMTGELTTW